MKMTPIAIAITSECTTSRRASPVRPAPNARATAEAIPPPIPPADIVVINITSG